MKKISFLIKILILFTSFSSMVSADKTNFFVEGKKLYEKNKFDQSKILFERDITFNPKSEKSYLYLAKIYSTKENFEEEEINLNNVLLLNPQNDEAIYMLTILRIKQSNYNEAEKLIKKFALVCKSFCIKKSEMQNKLDKLKPENGKSNN